MFFQLTPIQILFPGIVDGNDGSDGMAMMTVMYYADGDSEGEGDGECEGDGKIKID